MIPTIEDYLKGKVYITQDGTEDVHDSLSNVANACRDLIELHTKAALEAAYDCGRFKGWTNSEDENVHKELFVKNIMLRNQIK